MRTLVSITNLPSVAPMLCRKRSDPPGPHSFVDPYTAAVSRRVPPSVAQASTRALTPSGVSCVYPGVPPAGPMLDVPKRSVGIEVITSELSEGSGRREKGVLVWAKSECSGKRPEEPAERAAQRRTAPGGLYVYYIFLGERTCREKRFPAEKRVTET